MMSTTTPPESTSPPTTQPQLTHAHPMFAMLKKELRELLPWIVGLFIVYASIVAIACTSGTWQDYREVFNMNRPDPAHFILSGSFSAVTATGCPIIALLLGVLQYIFEINADRYALLTHRPMSRSSIFCTKTLMGLLAYGLITLPPLLAAFVWASTSHLNRSPFLWQMTLPSLADLLASSMYYFAGVLLIVRVRSGWFGSRALPLVVPVIGSAIALGWQRHWLLAGYILFGAVPLIIAAWSNFVRHGQILLQPLRARYSLAVIVIVSIYMVGGAVLAFADGETRRSQTTFRQVDFRLLEGGRVVRIESEPNGKRTAEILGGGPTPSSRDSNINPWSMNIGQDTVLSRVPTRASLQQNDSFSRSYSAYYSPDCVFEVGTCQIRGYVRSDGSHIVLYDAHKPYSLLGSLGQSGFEPGKFAANDPFSSPVVMIGGGMYLYGDSLFQLDQDLRSHRVFVAPDQQPLTDYGSASLYAEGAPQGREFLLFIATKQHIYCLSVPKFRPFAKSLEIVEQISRESGSWSLSIMWDHDHRWFATRYWPNWWSGVGHRNNQFAMLRHPDGSQTRIEYPTSYEEIINRERYAPFESLTAFMTPLVGTLLWTLEYVTNFQTLPFAAYTKDEELQLMIRGGLSLGLLSFGLTWLLMSRQSFTRGRKILWSTLAFLCGPAILLLRPVIVPSRILEPCPDCHKKRPVELTICPHCNNPWPPPPRDGREIIA